MSRKLKPATVQDCIDAENACTSLAQVRDLFKALGCPRTTTAIRKALKSAEGAVRHLETRRFLTERGG